MNQTKSNFFPTVTRPYNSWSDRRLATESKQIQTGFTANTYFPKPDPTVAVFGAAADAFITQLGKAAMRDANAIAAKNARRKELIALCVSLGASATVTAAGSLEKLVSTGLPIKKPATSVVLKNPENFKITNGINPGELVLKVKGSQAKSHVFEYTQDPPTDASIWTRTTCSTSRCIITGLTGGQKYWFRVAAIGGNDQMVWGDTILSPYVQ